MPCAPGRERTWPRTRRLRRRRSRRGREAPARRPPRAADRAPPLRFAPWPGPGGAARSPDRRPGTLGAPRPAPCSRSRCPRPARAGRRGPPRIRTTARSARGAEGRTRRSLRRSMPCAARRSAEEGRRPWLAILRRGILCDHRHSEVVVKLIRPLLALAVLSAIVLVPALPAMAAVTGGCNPPTIKPDWNDVPYKTLQDGTKVTTDIFVPPGQGPFPAVVTIHGSLWRSGCKENVEVEADR